MLTDLNTKLDKAKDLTRKLDRALALEYLWPELFDHGRSRAHWYGKAPQRNQLPDKPLHLYHEFHVYNGKKEKRMFDYFEVPEILGGGLKRENYRRMAKPIKD